MSKLILYYPLKPYIVNQKFGASLACREDNGKPISQAKIIGKRALIDTNDYKCPTGYISLYETLGMKGHTGCDLHADHGQPIYHAGPEGIAEEVQTEVERGLGLGIITKDKYELEGGVYQAKIRYWHLKSFEVRLGETVKLGQLVGYADNTGVTSGDHLHFECKPVIQNSNGVYYNAFQDNGYYGAIDPIQFFSGEYANTSTFKSFSQDMSYGDNNSEVVRLQNLLRELGYFDPISTGYYGNITKKAVYLFQIDEVKLSTWEYFVLRGSKCGPKTRTALNLLVKLNK